MQGAHQLAKQLIKSDRPGTPIYLSDVFDTFENYF